jgi:hypothetical protein
LILFLLPELRREKTRVSIWILNHESRWAVVVGGAAFLCIG